MKGKTKAQEQQERKNILNTKAQTTGGYHFVPWRVGGSVPLWSWRDKESRYRTPAYASTSVALETPHSGCPRIRELEKGGRQYSRAPELRCFSGKPSQ